MIVYIAGPMTGLPDLNYPAFNAAEEALTAAGHASSTQPATAPSSAATRASSTCG